MTDPASYERRMDPPAADWRHLAWSNGAFDTGRRPRTAAAEGVFRTQQHLVIVTLRGGALHQEVKSECGHRFAGADRAGAVSFVPAHCGRELKLSGIESEWASLALEPALLSDETMGDVTPGNARSLDHATFSNTEDRFLAGVAERFSHLETLDGGLDPLWCEEMALVTTRYLLGRYGKLSAAAAARPWRLPPWRLRRIAEHIDANLEKGIRIADLAAEIGVSAGYLHRAYRDSTGQTPLAFVNERRIRRAQHILEREAVSMAEIALRVGFQSPSHFTRTFQAATGITPTRYRALTR